MAWSEKLKPRTSNVVSVIVIALIVLVVSNFLYISIGGPSYFDFPFKIKQTSCGSALGAAESCTYPWIPSGIVLSIIFWVLVYVIASFLFYKKRK
jgi:hypothetical protein